MPHSRSRTVVLAATLVLTGASTGAAQILPVPESAPAARRTAVSVSPLGFLLGSYSADVEHAVSPFITLGLGATFQDASSLFYCCEGEGYDLDGSAKLRVYPGGAALRGFSVGVVAGGTVHRRRGTTDAGVDADSAFVARGGNVALTLGFTADYNWLARRDRRLLLGTGFGIKRRIVRDRDPLDDLTAIRPTLRAVVGYTF